MGTDMVLQLGILVLTLAIFFVLHKYPRQALNKIRNRGRSTAQANRHFIKGAQLLSRARSVRNRTTSANLAKDAAAEADKALAFDPRDAAAHILKALTLDLMGHKGSALRSLDTALSCATAKSLSGAERGDALVKRAELQIALNRKRRVESAVVDLEEAVSLSPGNSKAYCLLGQCYEIKGMKDEARKAFEDAIRLEPRSDPASQGLNRLATSS